jgi:hypothetical protein
MGTTRSDAVAADAWGAGGIAVRHTRTANPGEKI